MVVVTWLRAVFGLIFSVLQTGVCSILVLIFGTLGALKITNSVIRIWAKLWLAVFNVKVEVTKNEFEHGSQGVLYIFNHQSFYDIFAIHSVLQNTVRFGAKIELFKIPVLNLGMRAAGALPIARDNRREVFKVYEEASKKFKEKWSFILAPEGTRQSEPQIGRFKKGPFIFAINAQVPLIPVIISGTADVMPKNSLLINADRWSRTIKMSFLAPVSTIGLTVEQAPELAEKVHELFVAEYARISKLN